MNIYTGNIYYCLRHDQGCLIMNNNNHSIYGCNENKCIHNKIGKLICKSNDCVIEYNGRFNIQDSDVKEIVLFINKDKTYYDMCSGGWVIKYFKQEIYNSNCSEIFKYIDYPIKAIYN
jgi:hypothetical protein